MTLYYTGIGSRETPPDVCAYMEELASRLAAAGYRLRSGHAVGADRAFEQGAGDRADIYLPWSGFGTKPYKDDKGCPVLGTAICLGDSAYAANYTYLQQLGIRNKSLVPTRAIAALHGRNVSQVLGHPRDTATHSRFLICWCPEAILGAPQGGTRTALLLARHHGLPTFNLFRDEDVALFENFLLNC